MRLIPSEESPRLASAAISVSPRFGARFARPIGETDVPLLGMATDEAIACVNHLMQRGEATRSFDVDGVAWYCLAT